MYDIFYVSRSTGNTEEWQLIKSKYPTAQRLVNINSYQEIKSKSLTKMFWVIWDNIKLEDSFNLFNYQVTKWDDMYVHVFKNGEHYDGVCLFSKKNMISQREFDNRFFIDKKEVEIQASTPKPYGIFYINTYEEYLKSATESISEMFWVVYDDIIIDLNFKFDYQVSSHNKQITHIFKNGEHYDGVCLFSKNKLISKREFINRFFLDKKEIGITASRPKSFKAYTPLTFEEYQQITDNMFWIVWPEVSMIDESVFNLYFSHHNNYDRRENHAFKNLSNNIESYVNGIILCSKYKPLSKPEFNNRYLIDKKEHDRVVSTHRVYDVVFISYNEPNADDNYEKLLKHCPRAKRIHGIKGIHAAHFRAAEMCNTDMIWVVDGDAIIENDFNFDLVMTSYDLDCVHVWKSRNPINNLEYGNGGIKLLPRQLTLKMDFNTPDMTTSISNKFKAMDTISNTNAFNTDEFSTWRSAFRECCKLASGIIDRQYEEETQSRLEVWCTIGADKLYGKNSIQGALMGRAYGEANKNNADALCKINDFVWLQEKYNEI
jgi:hypothetical protein